MTRAEKIAEATRLRAEGLTLKAIGERFGVSPQTVLRWTDAEYNARSLATARALKESYRGTCVDCGASTNGSDGPGKASKRCVPCGAIKSGAERTVWTREVLITRIQEWASIHGEPPAMADWNPTRARNFLHDEERARRFEDADGYYPWMTLVVRVFGSWNAAIAAAGFKPRPRYGGEGNELRRRNVRTKATA